MALGNTYSGGNNQGQSWEPSYYSRLKVKNPTENTSLAFTFWKGTLKISITDTAAADAKNSELAYIHLSPTKARILAEGVRRIIANNEASDIFGVDTGIGETRGFIAIGREVGVPFLFIAKVNKNGSYESSQRFAFNVDYNYMLKVNDISNLKCQKEFMNDVELQQFVDLLEDYARSASGALGASFHDIGRYETGKLSNLVRKIAEKNGVESKGGYGGGRGSSFFDNSEEYEQPSNASSQKKSSYQSIDNLEDMLE